MITNFVICGYNEIKRGENMGREKIEITEDFKFFKQQLEAGELYLDEIQSREDCLIFCNRFQS